MQEGDHHRQQRGLLASVHRLGGSEHAGRLALQLTRDPQARRAVEKVLQGRGHVAKARRTAEHQPVGAPQVIVGRIGGAAGWNRFGRALVLGAHGWNRAQFGGDTWNALDAATDLPGELGG